MMNPSRAALHALILAAAAPLALSAETPPWTPLSLAACGVDRFAAEHAEADGRGVVIAVLDTGVEMDVAGLRETPDGEVKVIDARDFSGEGDLRLARVEPGEKSGTILIRTRQGDAITLSLPTEEGFSPSGVLLGTVLDEGEFDKSDAGDFDGDGKRESRFPILVFATEHEGERRYAAIIDSDRDGSLDGERVMFDYGVRQDHVRMRAPGSAEGGVTSIALNIVPEDRKLSLHFDSGAHGTHVAGIAAGYHLGGEVGFNGVAPGAKVISLKIGNGRDWRSPTTSGSMLRAFEYAAEYARVHDVPVVLNVSYGLNSEKDGSTEIDKAVERILRDNPRLIACISAGNEGPGLSTVGTPAGAPSAFAIGATLPPETIRDTRGAKYPHTAVATFSSRGGELPKPDFVTPGVAASSVPQWATGNDVFYGTSMAAPYASGLCARLVSLGLGRNSGAPARDTVKRALTSSAAMPEGTTALDVGAGLPDLVKAAQVFESLTPREREDDPSAIEVTTVSPMGDGTYSAAFVRGIVPPTEPQKFTVAAKFPAGAPRERLNEFHRRYFVRSRAAWIKPVEESIYLRASQAATVTLEYDTKEVSKPGLYIGDVELREEGTPDDIAPEAVLRTSIVIAERFDGDHQVRWADQKAEDSQRVARHFLFVPPWAPSVTFSLEAVQPREFGVHVPDIFMQDGRSMNAPGLALAKDTSTPRADWTWSRGIEPGVIEIPVLERSGEKTGEFTLTARLGAVAMRPTEGNGSWDEEKGCRYNFRATNVSEKVVKGTASARFESIRIEESADFGGEEGQDAWAQETSVGAETRAVRVRAEFGEEDYANFTDVVIEVEDGRGKRLSGRAMSTREEEFEVSVPSGTDQVLVRIKAGYAHEWARPKAHATVTIDRMLRSSIEGKVKAGGGEGTFMLHPGASLPVSVSFSGEVPDFGRDAALWGRLVLTNSDGGTTLVETELVAGKD